jgi:feruloyl esterase
MKLWILCSILAALLSGRCLADSCTKLASISLAETAITKVELVAAGPYTANSEFVNPPPVYDLPAHCRVVGFIHPTSDSKIGFEVWLPAGGWNGRFMQVGNGGLAGSIPHADMALTLAEGAATAGIDDGHVSASGFDGVWAIGHPEKLIDFGYRAVHLTAVVGKALVKAYYGANPFRP